MELSQPFNITSSRYYRLLVKAYMSRLWWLYALPFIAIIVTGAILSDVRFLFLLLIYAFIVVPMAFTFALINYGLHPVSRYSILLKRATVNADSIEFHFVCFLPGFAALRPLSGVIGPFPCLARSASQLWPFLGRKG